MFDCHVILYHMDSCPACKELLEPKGSSLWDEIVAELKKLNPKIKISKIESAQNTNKNVQYYPTIIIKKNNNEKLMMNESNKPPVITVKNIIAAVKEVCKDTSFFQNVASWFSHKKPDAAVAADETKKNDSKDSKDSKGGKGSKKSSHKKRPRKSSKKSMRVRVGGKKPKSRRSRRRGKSHNK